MGFPRGVNCLGIVDGDEGIVAARLCAVIPPGDHMIVDRLVEPPKSGGRDTRVPITPAILDLRTGRSVQSMMARCSRAVGLDPEKGLSAFERWPASAHAH